MSDIRVRFAPSPTGFLHVGGARTALFNWLYARQMGGVFVLRIEDTDRARSSDEMSQAILDGMEWLGLDWDEGPYHQADGIDQHRVEVQKLLDSGHGYRCFCPPDVLQEKRERMEKEGGSGYRYDRTCLDVDGAEAERRAMSGEPHTVRFRVPDGETAWADLVHDEVCFSNEDIDDFIVLRTDGTPVYMLAVVSDDAEMGISHVLRGDDHLSNTPKQLLLYRALGLPEPRFGHLPMILGPDGRRLSKRHGATAVSEYRDAGILPQALDNFLALLGWNPGDDQEIMLEHELIARFSLERIGKKSAVFDPEKLDWMNGQHIMLMDAHELGRLVAPLLIEEGLTTEEELEDRADWFATLMELLQPRARTLTAIAEQARIFLATDIEYEEKAVGKHWKDADSVIERLTVVQRAFDEVVEDWNPGRIEEALRAAAEREGVGFGKLVHPLRLALTGGSASPGIDQVAWLLGPNTIHERIAAATAFLQSRSSAELHG
ncbi:MAG: glutamate--tRNA ligase [Gemmatimonas sp.]|nr:glutamate--tRNA ligase [Gemmatimonas sp.]